MWLYYIVFQLILCLSLWNFFFPLLLYFIFSSGVYSCVNLVNEVHRNLIYVTSHSVHVTDRHKTLFCHQNGLYVKICEQRTVQIRKPNFAFRSLLFWNYLQIRELTSSVFLAATWRIRRPEPQDCCVRNTRQLVTKCGHITIGSRRIASTPPPVYQQNSTRQWLSDVLVFRINFLFKLWTLLIHKHNDRLFIRVIKTTFV